MNAEIRLIGPVEAEQLLAANVHNRRERSAWTAELAKRMSTDVWTESWDAIAVDREGFLLNGQHRLTAIIMAGVTLALVVVTDLDPFAFKTGDRPKVRTNRDFLERLNLEAPPKLLAAMLRQLNVYLATGDMRSGGLGREFTAQEAEYLLKRFPGVVQIAHEQKRIFGLTASTQALLRFLFAEVDTADADAFWEGVRLGAELRARDSRMLLRNRLTKEINRNGNKADQRHLAALTIKAFNWYREGIEYSKLIWQPGGANAEPFPRIKDLPMRLWPMPWQGEGS